MKILIAIDSFKGSMTSVTAGNAAATGIGRVFPDADIVVKPVADGGEGTVESLVQGLHGEIKKVTVKNPLGNDITAEYGIIGDNAVIEMSAASGIALIPREELSPMNTTTYGVGQMILDAAQNGCRNFIIGIGGSATNDCGIGMLQALGYDFIDAEGRSVGYGAKYLSEIKTIDASRVNPLIKDCKFSIACDVTNPLYGPNGCSEIFSPQKGATPEEVKLMDAGMISFSETVKKYYSKANPDYPGSGAAGGLGFAFMTFLDGDLKSGIELILDKISIEKEISDSDLVITGEGKIDSQTVMGKAPIGIARLAKKHGKPVIAFSGCVSRDANVCNSHGIDAVFPIVRTPCTLSDAMDEENAKNNMADCVEQVMCLMRLKC